MEKLRVLIADDDDDMRKQMILLLCRNYDIVGAVANDRELVRAASCLLPDVIVTDIFTPRIDGVTARNRLIAQGNVIPFVFVSRKIRGVINVLEKERSVAFVYKKEISMHLVKAVERVHQGAIRDSLFCVSFFDRQPEDQNVVLIDEDTLSEAERMVVSCEGCSSEAQIFFEEILDRLTGSDPSVTDYLLKKPGICPNCLNKITEKTLVELHKRR